MIRTSTNTPRRLVGALAVASALLGVGSGAAGTEEGGEISRGYEQARASATPLNGSEAFDAVAVRPTTFLTSVFSAATFVISLPFTALDPAIGAGKARETLVDYPFNDTFKRPLGDLDAMGNPAEDPSPE